MCFILKIFINKLTNEEELQPTIFFLSFFWLDFVNLFSLLFVDSTDLGEDIMLCDLTDVSVCNRVLEIVLGFFSGLVLLLVIANIKASSTLRWRICGHISTGNKLDMRKPRKMVTKGVQINEFFSYFQHFFITKSTQKYVSPSIYFNRSCLLTFKNYGSINCSSDHQVRGSK